MNYAAARTWPKIRRSESTIEASIDLAVAEVNELRGKMLAARKPALKSEYEAQWRAARLILAALLSIKRSLIHAN
jgi:hypothetical protein